MNIIEFIDDKSFIDSAVENISDVCNGKESYVSLCGGSTPSPIYTALSDSNLDLSKVSFYQGDERYIPKNSELSNYRLISESLFKNKDKEVKDFFYFDTNLRKEECLKDYTNKLNLIPTKKFDLTILGIGPDGHIASLFPNSTALDEYEKLCMSTYTEFFDVRDRLSISIKMILESKKIMVLLNGERKRCVLDELEKGTKSYNDFPAKILKEHLNVDVLFLAL
jgi:6-phosphogluconolactonase